MGTTSYYSPTTRNISPPQARVDAHYVTPAEWQRKGIFNVAGMGFFSAGRMIADYANDTWKVHTL